MKANIIDLTNPIKKYGNSCTLCPHPERKHYAKGMCNYCYHTQGRVKIAKSCKHTDRLAYARGMCHSCY